MAKTSMVEREKHRAKTVQKYAAKRAQLKELIRSPRTSDEARAEAQVKLQKLPRDASPTRGRNRCQLTGRPKGYIRLFGISRNTFRALALEGKIPGVTKSSW